MPFLDFGTMNITIGLSPTLEAWVKAQTSTNNATLARIEAKLDAATLLETKEMAAIDDAIADLTTKVAANTSVTGSVKAFLAGIPQLISDAVAKAVAAGATPAEVQAVTDLGTALQANSDALSAALVAGTPAAA